MNWSIYSDNNLIYDPRLDDYKITTAKLNLELNKAGRLQFTVYPNHPNFERITKLKPTITARWGDALKFRGRELDDTVGWNNERAIVCESELAFFNDSIQRPFSFPLDDTHTAPADYFAFLVNRHNEQVPPERQFVVGICTVTDPNNYIARSDTEYSTTWRLLNEGLLDTLGGYLWTRHEDGVTYIDYLADFDVLAQQPVEYGVNLLNISTTRKGADVCTAILPLGKADEETEERVTISERPDEETDDICKEGDIVYSKKAEEIYGGRITKVITWDDVTIPANLLTKAKARLGKEREILSTVALTAADLAAAGYDINTFSLGTYVQIVDEPHKTAHGLADRYLVKKLSLDLLNPANSKLTLGATTSSLTGNNRKTIETTAKTIETNVNRETSRAVRNVEQRNAMMIQGTEEALTIKIREETYTKGEVDEKIGAVSTEINAVAGGIEINFTELQRDINDVQAGADARFTALQSYIRLEGGTMTFGEVGNDITLTVENDRIGIYSGGVLVTYWTVSDMVAPFTLRIPVGGRLVLGDYAFIPRSNGSLDFRWIGV